MDIATSTTPEPPKFLNPIRGHGIAECVLGLLLIALGWHGFQVANQAIREQFPGVSPFDLTELISRMAGDVARSVQIGGPALAGVFGLLAGIAYLLASLSKICVGRLPGNTPGDWYHLESLVWAMRHASIPPTNEVESGLLGAFRQYISQAIDYVPRSYQPVVLGHIGAVPYVMGALAALLVISPFPIPLGEWGHFGLVYFDATVPTLAVSGVIAVLVFQIISAKLLLPPTANTEVCNHRQQVKSSGHPRTVFEELRGVLTEQAGGSQSCRRLMEEDVEMKSDHMSDVGKAHGSLVYESAPRPHEPSADQGSLIGHAHSAVGAMLIILSVWCFLSLRKVALISHPTMGLNLAPPIVTGVMGILLFWLGARTFGYALPILRRNMYRSTIFAVDLTGTFFRSEVAIGMGMSDSIRSSSTAVRGELFLDYMIATCYSEADARGRRHLVDLEVDPVAKRHLESLKRTVTWNEERGASLLGVELLTAHQAQEIAQANTALIQSRQHRLGLQQAASATGPPPVQARPETPMQEAPRWAARVASIQAQETQSHQPLHPVGVMEYSPSPFRHEAPALPAGQTNSPFAYAQAAPPHSSPASPFTERIPNPSIMPASPLTASVPFYSGGGAASPLTANVPHMASPFDSPASPLTAPTPFHAAAAPASPFHLTPPAQPAASPFFAAPPQPFTAAVPPMHQPSYGHQPAPMHQPSYGHQPAPMHGYGHQPAPNPFIGNVTSPHPASPFAAASAAPPPEATQVVRRSEPIMAATAEVLQVLPGRNVPLTPEQLQWMRQQGLPPMPAATASPLPPWMQAPPSTPPPPAYTPATTQTALVPLANSYLPIPTRAAVPEQTLATHPRAEPHGMVLSPYESPATLAEGIQSCPSCLEPLEPTVRMCPYCGQRM